MRFIRCVFGLAVSAFGSYMSIQANVGLAPWDAFSIGVGVATGLTKGTIYILTGVLILGLDLALRGKIGFGTLLNTFLIGTFIDLYSNLNVIPEFQNFGWGIVMMLAGQFILCVGIVWYMAPGLGAGPRDTLMVQLGKRLKKLPIGVVRGFIEATVLVIGWLLGAKVGVGTIIAVFGISFILQLTLKLFNFDVKTVYHESVIETTARIFKLGKYKDGAAPDPSDGENGDPA